MNGQGWLGSPDLTAAWIAAISVSSMATGVLPIPTMRETPGTIRIGNRFNGSRRQNTYPGKSGHSISLNRSDHRRRHRYRGRNDSKPIPLKWAVTIFSYRLLTCNANHG